MVKNFSYSHEGLFSKKSIPAERQSFQTSTNKKAEAGSHKIDYSKDNRIGRLHDVKTDRGTFRFKDNRTGD